MNITLNSFGTDLAADDRRELYPNFGLLYPEGIESLGKADDQEKVRQAVDHIEVSSLVSAVKLAPQASSVEPWLLVSCPFFFWFFSLLTLVVDLQKIIYGLKLERR